MLNLLNLRFKLLKDDKWIIVIMVAMTLVLTFVFTSSMSGDYKPSAVVIDNNKTPTSQRLISELNNSISMNFRLVEIEKGKELIEKGNVIGGIIIPKFFDQQVLKGEEIDLELIKSKDSLELFQLQNTIRSEIFKLQSTYITGAATIDVLKKKVFKLKTMK